LTFQALAFQPESIEANKEIIEQWNADHPDIQVEYLQGDWASVQDQLVTAFEGGTAPDLVHYESSYLQDFADRGWLLDLTDMISDEMKDDIRDGAWDAVTFDEDRKSTRLNSSHVKISYAVFCLKKKINLEKT